MFGASAFDQTCHEFCRDRLTRIGDLVLAGVAKVGDDNMDVFGEAAFQGVDNQEELHEILIDVVCRCLDHEAVAAADAFTDLHIAFTAGKLREFDLSRCYSELLADFRDECGVASATKDFEVFVRHQHGL